MVAPDHIRETRIMERDGITRAEAQARINQTDQREKIRYANRVLINDSERSELIKKAGNSSLRAKGKNNMPNDNGQGAPKKAGQKAPDPFFRCADAACADRFFGHYPLRRDG